MSAKYHKYRLQWPDRIANKELAKREHWGNSEGENGTSLDACRQEENKDLEKEMWTSGFR